MKTFAEGSWERPPKIILGVDIGTTESAVAFTYLYPGGPQCLHRVTAWPGQEAQKGESKVPTLVYYDSGGKAASLGAEALNPETIESAEAETWQLARYFKLHLHPDASRMYRMDTDPLPTGVSLLTIYTDFMAYLLKHTKDYFESRIIDGKKIWMDYYPDMTIVFAHPNGWGLKEQNFLRQAAIAANYVTSCKAQSQILFVSEAEASVHFCVLYGNLQNRLKPSTTFVVCDAGGSTIDTTVYAIRAMSPTLELEERKTSACVQVGGIFIDREFEQHLARILSKVKLDEESQTECRRRAVEDFKSFSKKEFNDVGRQYRVDLGSRRLKHDEFGIKRGTIALDGQVIKNFFEMSVTKTIESIRHQMSGLDCKHILLVGGLGNSLYLRGCLIEEFGKDSCSVHIANESTAKAVADGAVIWCSKYSVTSRATRTAFGVDINVPYDPSEPSHEGRHVHRHAAGYDYLIHKWSEIVGKGLVVAADSVIRETYWCSYRMANPRLDNFMVTLFSYAGNGTPGSWLRDQQGKLNEGFERVGVIEVDLNTMREALKRRVGRNGDFYYLLFTLMFMFGGTELQVAVEWEQNGEIRTMPARILPAALPSS